MSYFRDFLTELKRRRVWRVAVVYTGAAFVVVEAADLFLPNLGLPEWTVRLVAMVAVIGFPVALILAWAFDLTDEGVRPAGPGPGGGWSSVRVRRLAAGSLAMTTLIVALAGWWAYGPDRGPEIRRLAVLPLVNLTGDEDQAYFVQGMHDRLISALQQAGVPVIARTSVAPYGPGETPVRDIARELGVDAVIEGSVYRVADRVTIETRLVDGTTEEYLWQESFAGDLRDLSVLYGDLTRSIAGEIRRAVNPASRASAEPETVDPRAYEAYLRGVFYLQRFNEEDLSTALGYFQRALEIDSTYAPAWVGVAKVWGWGAGPPEERGPRSDSALERALKLDPDLADAHFMVASKLAWADWDFAAAEQAFVHALQLNPGDAEGHLFYGHVLTILGRFQEGAEHADRGLELDPLNPMMQWLHASRLLVVGRRDEAISRLRDMLRRTPGMGVGGDLLANALRGEGRHDEAIEEWTTWYESRGEIELAEELTRGFDEGGARQAYRRLAGALASGRQQGSVIPVVIAGHWMYAGDEDAALDWLATGLDERDSNMAYIGVIPAYAPLHNHPRFREIARRVGVPIIEPSER